MQQHYTDIDAFYAARGGAKSPECDFGGFHYVEAEERLPRHLRERWRVSVVALNGDVYAEASRTGEVRLLGRLAGGPYGHLDERGRVVIRSHDDKARAYVDADLAFADWAQVVGRAVEWFERRLAAFNEEEHTEGERAHQQA